MILITNGVLAKAYFATRIHLGLNVVAVIGDSICP